MKARMLQSAVLCAAFTLVVFSVVSLTPAVGSVNPDQGSRDEAGAPSAQQAEPTQGDSGQGKKPDKEKPKFKDQELLVRFKKDVGKEDAKAVHAKHGAQVLRSYTVPEGLYLVKIPKGRSLGKVMAAYKATKEVLYVEPNYVYTTQATPNDPSFTSLWGLNNTGQTGGTADADINAPEAWDQTTGSAETIIAVIDTGVDYNHQDLANNIWTNPGEIPGNGIDDDGNGYIDDVHGINAITNSGNPMDDNNHGTHVSGTIAALGNNSVGVVGVNWNAKIIACKFLDSSGSGYTADAVECLNYLYILKTRTSNPVNITASSNSWGGGGFSQALLDAIDAHRQAGILFIAAAGNSSSNNDTVSTYPAGYYLPNIIAVAATDHTDSLASFSNYGRHTVHVGAPGVNILSTTTGNTYSTFSGTSMATPHVSGLVGLLKSQDPARDWRSLKNLVLAGGQSKAATTGKTITGKRIRAYDTNGVGSLSCSGQTVASRLLPIGSSAGVGTGSALTLAFQNINCDVPNGDVVVVASDGPSITLKDDGLGVDQASGDGIYSGQWTPSAEGTYTLTFPGSDVVTVTVAQNYLPAVETDYVYRSITGTKLTLGDDQVSTVSLPFPIYFNGDPAGSTGYTTAYISSNGNISFTTSNSSYSNTTLPSASFQTLAAPFWDDLNPGAASTTGGVYVGTVGTAPNREYVVEWRDVPHYSCGGALKFQAVFFENSSDVLFNYANVGIANTYCDAGGSATVGVQINSGLAQQYSANTPSLRNSLALLWSMLSTKADAGPDQSVLPGAAVVLDGRGSSTREGTIASYAWTQTAGDPVSLIGADTATPGFTAPAAKSTLTFQLTITTSTGRTASDTVNVYVSVPPVANAGPDQNVITNFTVSLDGTGSYDPDGTIAGYAWIQTAGTAVSLTGANTATPSFMAPSTAGALTFQLTARDDSGHTASDTVTIAVKAPPVANAGPDQLVVPGASVALNGTGSYDPDGTITSYSWVQTAGAPVTLTGADTATPGFIAPDSGQTLTFQLTVTDNSGLSSNDTVNIIVNVPPVANAGPDQTAVSGTAVALDGTGSYDPDGTIVSYGWTQVSGPTVTLSGATTSRPSFTAPWSPGTVVLRLTVTDNNGQSMTDTVSILILTPPTANAGPDQTVPAGSTVTLSGSSSSDPDGTIMGYSWVQTAGAPVSLTGANTATPSFVSPLVIGDLTFQLTVTDNMGYSSSDSVVIKLIDSYLAPVAVEYEYRTITGTKLSLSDDQTATLTSPFPVRMSGSQPGYTTFYVSSNGAISFTTNNTSYSNAALPTTTFQNLVAPFWDDLNPSVAGTTGGVYWQVTGAAPNRELVVEWRDVPHYSCGGAATFQAVFFENSPGVLFNYADVVFNSATCDYGASATVGMQSTSTSAQQYSYNSAKLKNLQALLWRTRLQLVANAGADQFVLPGAAGALNGTASSDPNGSIVSYSWVQVSGAPVGLTGADTATPGFVAPGVNETLVFRLTVTDDSGEIATDTVNIIVNTPPVAEAGPDQTAVSGTAVTLNGSGSNDPDGPLASYSWIQTAGASVALSEANTATPGFTAPATPGTLTFQLTVKDSSGQTAADTVNVIVNVPPVAEAGPDQTVTAGSTVTLNGAASHDDGGTIISYAWTQTAGTSVALTGVDTATPNFAAPNESGTLTFTLTVTDDNGATASDTVNISVDLPPVAEAGPDQAVTSGATVTLNGTGSYDPDGTIASYAWVQTAGATVVLTGAATATPTFIAPNASGTLTFVLTVTDNSGATASDMVSVSVNLPPVAEAGPDQAVTSGVTVTLNGAGSYDPDGTIVSYAWTQTAGAPVVLGGANTATPSFTAPATAGTLSFRLTVTDNAGSSASAVVNIVVNMPPVANAGPDITVKSKSIVTLNGTGSYDPDGAIVSYAWTQTEGTPVVLGGAGTATPGFTAPNSAETLAFRLTVTDDKGISVSDEVNIVVSRSGT